MSIPSLQDLQSDADRLSLRATFRPLDPGRRACHLYREGSPFVAASGFGTTDAEALAEALGRYRREVAASERALAAERRDGAFACPTCLPLWPEDRGCADCFDGRRPTACCAYCDAEVAPEAVACQCGDADFALCVGCATPGRHLAQCSIAAPAQEAAA